jgi:hypothetical protein
MSIKEDQITGTEQAICNLTDTINDLTPHQRDRTVRVQIRQHLDELAVLRAGLKELKGL